MRRASAAVLLLTACGGGSVGTIGTVTPTVPASVVTSPAPTSQATSTVFVSPRFDGEWFDRVVVESTLASGALDVQAAVVRDGEVVHVLSASSDSSSAPVSDTTRFRIASISKVVTAMAVMKLVEDGRLSLDDRPVRTVADRMGLRLADERMGDITVFQLMSHTSGFASAGELFFDSPELDVEGLLGIVFGTELDHQPGSRFVYSNTNFVILGRLIAGILDTTWDDAVNQLVLRPLGFEDWAVGRTSVVDPSEARPRVKPGRNYMELLEAAGAWTAPAKEVALVIDALARDQFFIDPATGRSMVAPSSAGPPDADWTYGLGIRIFPGGVWGHSGTLESAHDMVIRWPDGTVVCVLVNGDEPTDTDRLLEIIRWALLPGSSSPFETIPTDETTD